jgi:hypothetical protein
VGCLCAAGAGGIERHQQDAMKGTIRSVDQPRNLLLTEHPGKVAQLLGLGVSAMLQLRYKT